MWLSWLDDIELLKFPWIRPLESQKAPKKLKKKLKISSSSGTQMIDPRIYNKISTNLHIWRLSKANRLGGIYDSLSTAKFHQNKTPAMIYISHTLESCQPGGFVLNDRDWGFPIWNMRSNPSILRSPVRASCLPWGPKVFFFFFVFPVRCLQKKHTNINALNFFGSLSPLVADDAPDVPIKRTSEMPEGINVELGYATAWSRWLWWSSGQRFGFGCVVRSRHHYQTQIRLR